MSKIGFFVAGAAAGAIAALLYAPKKGEETRAAVVDKVNALWGEAKDWTANAGTNVQAAYETAAERGSEVINSFAGDAASAVQAAEAEAAPVFTEASDDLREKIEAARARIAAQVAKNAEEAQASAATATEVPVEVAPVEEEAAE